MSKRNLFIFIVILLVVGGSVYGLKRIKKESPAEELFPEQEEELVSLSQETITYFTDNISNLSPEPAVLGGTWYITRFSLVDENHLYIDYEDGHIMRRLLLEKSDTDWKVLGFFQPGKDMWELVEGQDTYLGSPLTIYDMSENGEWSLVY